VPGLSSRGIFLSYQREDTGPYARLLERELADHFPDARVFMDLDATATGSDLAEATRQAVGSCAVLVALIGRQWATLAKQEGHGQLDNPGDVTRLEVQTALERGARVIPVLVDGASPLQEKQLPADLQRLGRLHALELNYGRYDDDAGRIIEAIERVLAEASATSTGSPSRFTAKAREKGKRQAREQANRRATDWDDLKALYLATTLEVRGDLAGARTVLQRAIDTGAPDIASAAAHNLGIMLQNQGDMAGAQAAYQQAADLGAPEGAIRLGDLLKEQGDAAGARAAYGLAINSGHADYAPAAAVALGDLLKEQGDLAGARTAYQQAFSSGHSNHAPAAAAGLANLLKAQGDLAAERAAYQRFSPGHHDAARGAAVEPETPLGAARKAMQEPPARTLKVGRIVFAVAFSPDGTLLAIGSSARVSIWNLRTGDIVWKRRLAPVLETAPVQAVSFSPDGTRLATGCQKSAQIWDAATGQEQLRITHTGMVMAAVFSPDGKRLATGSTDKSAYIWNTSTGQQQLKVTHAFRVAAVPVLQDWVQAVAFSPDGTRLATASDDKTAQTWNAITGERQLQVTHLRGVRAVAFSPDGARLATGSNDKTARIWNAAARLQQLQLAHDGAVRAVAFSPDGARLATGSTDKTARIWNAATGQLEHQFTHDGKVLAVAFSPGGTRLATGSHDKTARIWEIIAP
jgi:WD40 repeat protein/tetratricopeptide (TPR) repeat protein